MRCLYTLLLLTFITVLSGCRDDFETVSSTGDLRFSRDTVYLDTVFTNIGSSTYNLKVYNDSKEAITIPTLRLSQGEESNYRLNVDGVPGRVFSEVEILAQDSIFIFIESTIDITAYDAPEGEFLYTDEIEFDSGENLQRVPLVTLVRDAIFLFPERDGASGIIETLTVNNVETDIQGRYLMDDELNFTNEKPYVIYGYMAVGDPDSESAKTLTIEAGARLHFHENSGLIVANNASLAVNGALSSDPDVLENEVIFESDRLEPAFSDIPGQWGTILLTEGSINNVVNYATIKNGTIGILNESNTVTENPNLTISNTQIYNHSAVGLLNRFSTVEGSNLVINNAGQFSLLIQLGGNYNFTHCTITNYWSQSLRNTPAVFLDNTLQVADTLFVADLSKATFTNSIIYGSRGEEIEYNNEGNTEFNFQLINTLVKFEDSFGSFENLPLYDFTNTALYENIFLNEMPDFLAPLDNQLQIGLNSAGISNGLTSAALSVPFDLNGIDRTNSPDLGAYQYTLQPE